MRDLFNKGYTSNWSNKIFIIANVQNTNPVTLIGKYLLKDLEGKDNIGGFYELKHPNVYLAEKVLRKKGNKVYVKFSGIDEKGWILKKALWPWATSGGTN